MAICKKEYYRFINLLVFIAMLLYVLLLCREDIIELRILAVVYIGFNILCSFIQKDMFWAWPVLIIRATGLVRYVMIMMVARDSSINNISNQVIFIMSLEIFAQYIIIFMYPRIKNRVKCLDNYRKYRSKKVKVLKFPNFKVGITMVCVLIVGGTLVVTNKAILMQYFSLSFSNEEIVYQNGLIGLLVSAFFLLVYVFAIQSVEKKPIKEWIKILLLIVFSIFFIKGTSVTAGNVSRWSLLITMFIAYNFLTLFHPKQKKKLLLIMIFSGVLALLFGTMLKFGSGHSGYDSIENTLQSTFTYKMLNAYFAGPDNVEVALNMSEKLESKGMTYKIQMIVSDIFNNFPLLNKYLSVRSDTSVYWFNISFYGSTIASDQIIPLVGQLYNYIGILFIIPEMFIIWIALNVNFKLKQEKELLKVYCLAYMCCTFSLCNCTNLIIMLQSLWIQIMPIYIIYIINKKLKLREKL